MYLHADHEKVLGLTVTFHLHYGVIGDVLAAGILLSLASGFVVLVTRDENHGSPLEPLEGPTLPFLRISVDVCLERCNKLRLVR